MCSCSPSAGSAGAIDHDFHNTLITDKEAREIKEQDAKALPHTPYY